MTRAKINGGNHFVVLMNLKKKKVVFHSKVVLPNRLNHQNEKPPLKMMIKMIKMMKMKMTTMKMQK